MSKRIPSGIKVVSTINIVVNLLLLIPCFFILKFMGSVFFSIGLFIIIVNIILGIGVLLLKTRSRRAFVAMQIVNLTLSVWPFMCFLTLGLGSAGKFGDDHIPWAPISTFLFWEQMTNFIVGMLFPMVPMLLSIFYMFYFTHPKVKKVFT